MTQSKSEEPTRPPESPPALPPQPRLSRLSDFVRKLEEDRDLDRRRLADLTRQVHNLQQQVNQHVRNHATPVDIRGVH